MSKKNFYESRGLVTDREVIDICTTADPFGLGDRMNLTRKIEIFKLWTTESYVVVQVEGEEIKRSESHNDFYGFMSSAASDDTAGLAEKLAKKYADKPSFEVLHIVELKGQTSIFEPNRTRKFYHASVSYHPITHGHWQRGTEVQFWEEGNPVPDSKQLYTDTFEEKYIISRNGVRTQGFDRIVKKVKELVAKESSGKDRYKAGDYVDIVEKRLEELSKFVDK